ncbi:hypothetical protein PSTG_20157, partial [Puccinia striiformis f. sp. tritici PST-78]
MTRGSLRTLTLAALSLALPGPLAAQSVAPDQTGTGAARLDDHGAEHQPLRRDQAPGNLHGPRRGSVPPEAAPRAGAHRQDRQQHLRRLQLEGGAARV